MKKMVLSIFILLFAMSVSTFAIKTAVRMETANRTSEGNIENRLSDNEMEHMMARIDEIKEMDKSVLNSAEKRELKNELKEIKSNVRNSSGTIVIGTGTLLLIIILLILFL